ncbi:MAG: asparagine synthase (glutamine-hydrolyzing) [Ferruginibacter sp.]
MCGIAGIYKYNPPRACAPEESVKKMLSVINHRGPDEAGIYKHADFCMGNVRLSIIDIASGKQPLSDESGNYWIVYNGEIFNYRELQQLLQQKGVHLKTNSDTEVLVQLYALFGADCLRYLNGQFSFCIWNRAKQEFFLARDRVGIRPLFYWSDKETFAFCSEIKGLFTLEAVPRELEPESLAQIFTFWTTLTPATPFKNIYELPPGHYMEVSGNKRSIKKYWSLDYTIPDAAKQANTDVAKEELESLLKDATAIRMRADVPVAAYLSGGLDSSVTTALIRETGISNLHTFSIGFKNKDFDETAYQTEAAAYFKTRHTSFECTAADIAANFEKAIWHTEFPLLRTSPVPMFLLSQKVRQHDIKVVITGEGADEVMAGYDIFKEAKIKRFWASQPGSKARPRLLSKLYPYIPMIRDASNLSLKMFFGYRLMDTGDPLYSHLLRWHNTARIKTYFSDSLNASVKNYNPLEQVYETLPAGFNQWTGLAQSQYLESVIFMSGYLLSSQGDRVAMANSVEGRYPFLDYRVVEFCAKLPDRLKLNCLNEKFLLKKIAANRIPASIVKRPKQAYRAPIAQSFFGEGAPDAVAEILSGNNIAAFDLFNAAKVEQLVSKIKNQQNFSETDEMALAGIISTQLLYKMFIQEPVKANTAVLTTIKFVEE